jgi:hypothetical protein
MSRIADERTELVFQTGVAPGVPKAVGPRAGRMLHLLIAAASLQDVGVIGPIARFASTGQYGVNVEGKWYLTFVWDPLIGAKEIRLERR